jgi:thioesterase domain-containing protein
LTVEELRKLEPDDQIRHFLERAQAAQLIYPDFGLDQAKYMLEVYKANYRAYYEYVPKPYAGSVLLFRATDTTDEPRPNYAALEALVGSVEIVDVPGGHHNIALEPNVGVLAKRLQSYMDNAAAVRRGN